MRIAGRKFGLALLSGAGLLSLTALLGAAQAETKQYRIAPQPLGEALQAFGAQSGHAVIVDPELARSKKSPGVIASAGETSQWLIDPRPKRSPDILDLFGTIALSRR